MTPNGERSAFHDHFGSVADRYAAWRPTYPDALFAWLATVAPARDAAWDCATGSGQAARGLAAHFAHVHATDASAAQLAHAPPLANVTYRVAPAEQSPLPDASIDLVTVAQAFHYLDHARFHAEARRVLRPRAVIAVWTYNLPTIDGPGALTATLERFYHDILGPCWPAERRHVENGYAELPFPFAVLDLPAFAMTADWSLPALLGYVSSWSAVPRYLATHGHDPLPLLHDALLPLWQDPARTRRIDWPLTVRAGTR